MSTAMTAAGESLVARLQAEGKPLVIDRMIFAHIPGQDHTQPIAPGVTVPAEPVGKVEHTFAIPQEYRAYVNPNQVVYSALLGSDVGDFTFNWQGLYCSAHDVLVAVATFPALEKRKYDVATGKTGNNLTRNFLLTFTGAREITGLTISADVWQLDFTVRLKGMDERTRLANFDLYGQGYFEGDGWLLKEKTGNYSFTPGLGYVGGIRAMLDDVLPLPIGGGVLLPQNVWLSVCLRPVGSDRVAEASPMLVPVGVNVADAEDETGLMHYRQIVARIEIDGTVTDLRPKRMQGLPPEKVGAASCDLKIIASAGIAGGGKLTDNITVEAEWLWNLSKNYPAPFLIFGHDLKVYMALQPSGLGTPAGVREPGKAGSEAYWVDYGKFIAPPPMEKYDLGEFYYFRHPTLKPGFQPAHGGLLANAATLYPKAWAYLQTAEGQKLCTTEAQWQAMVNAVWHVNADGSRVGWNGIGGAPYYVLNTGNGKLRMPDLRGMYIEAAGFDSLGVGTVHGDGARNALGYFGASIDFISARCRGPFFISETGGIARSGGALPINLPDGCEVGVNLSRVVPTAAKNQPRAWGSLACVCLDPATS